MAKEIFISFASADKEAALNLCKALEGRGLSCWISCRDVPGGGNFQKEIAMALKAARVMLLVFSTHVMNSEEILKELALASQHKLVVIPARIEDVMPTGDGPYSYELSTRQWIDLFGNWENAVEDLAARIKQILLGDAAPQAQIPASKPVAAKVGFWGLPRGNWLVLGGLFAVWVLTAFVAPLFSGPFFLALLGFGIFFWGKKRARARA